MGQKFSYIKPIRSRGYGSMLLIKLKLDADCLDTFYQYIEGLAIAVEKLAAACF